MAVMAGMGVMAAGAGMAGRADGALVAVIRETAVARHAHLSLSLTHSLTLSLTAPGTDVTCRDLAGDRQGTE
jgi:hypothetical protein